MTKKSTKKTETKEEAPKEENKLEDADESQDEVSLSEDVKNPSMKKDGDYEVGDPQELRPQELPFVISKPKGGFNSEREEQYWKNLNAYAYKNPEKWEEKKSELIERLKEIRKSEKASNKYMSNDKKVSYQSKAHQ